MGWAEGALGVKAQCEIGTTVSLLLPTGVSRQ